MTRHIRNFPQFESKALRQTPAAPNGWWRPIVRWLRPRGRALPRVLALVTVLPALAAAAMATAAATGAIMLHTGPIDTLTPHAQAQRSIVGNFTGKRLHLVQFVGPVKPQWLAELASDGLTVVTYVPDHAYLVWGDASALGRMQVRSRAAGTSLQWDGPWKDEYKAHPSVWADEKSLDQPLAARRAAVQRFQLQLVADATENAATLRELAALGGSEFSDPGALPGYLNRFIALPPATLALFLARPDIVSLHPYIEPQLADERQAIIVAGNLNGNGPAVANYFDQLNAWGFTQGQFNSSGLVVDVADDGADVNPAGGIPNNAVAGPVAANHFVMFEGGNRPLGAPVPSGTSRYVYKGLFGTPGSDGGLGNGGHGQLNMTIIGGHVPSGSLGGVNFGAFPHADVSGFRFGLGVAPFVRMGNSVVFDPNFTTPTLTSMLSSVYAANARISSNSWGANAAGAYNLTSQTYDGLVRDAQSGTAGSQPMVVVFSAGNTGPSARTVGAPGSAKNVITVGAAEGVQAFGGADGCGIADTGADSANDMISFSSRGPAADGRRKPDLVAPGTHISGIAFVTPNSTGNGTAVATYRFDGVCGGVGGTAAFPAGQAWYTASSGTSHSTPAVSGGAALVYQQFLNNPSYLAANRQPATGAPSPALVKSYLMNTTRYMTGIAANDTLWSNVQGMGMLNLGTAFDGVSRVIRDQVTGDRFSASGQVRQFSGTVADVSRPLRITLGWTDAPGPTVGDAYVNNLDLVVVAGGNVYRGNVFAGASSVTGGAADTRNNVESVFLPAGAGTEYTVIVSATNIAAQADPAVVGLNQDFALVGYNSGPLTPSATAILAPGITTVTSDNAIIEPNECNTLNAGIANLGTGNATVVSSVLSTTTPGVLITQPASAYPTIAGGGSANNAAPFQVSTSNAVACGSTIAFTNTVTFAGGTSPATLQFSLPVGQAADPNYSFAQSTGAIPAGGTLIPGSTADDATVLYAAPFAFSVYGTAITAGSNIRVSTNGNVQMTAGAGNSAFSNTALPATAMGAFPVVLPYWDDLLLTGAGNGVFADVTGSAPNRTLKLEWRGTTFTGGNPVNFAVFFHENSEAFEFVYNNSASANGASATVGTQATNSGTNFTQFSFNQAVITSGLRLAATRTPPICSPGPAQCAASAPSLTSGVSTGFTTGTAGSFTFTATGVPPPAIAVTGTLPAGVTYTPGTRILAGTPAAGTAGSYPLSVTATNGVPPNANQNFTLIVNAPTPPSGGFASGTTYVTSASNAVPTVITTLSHICPASGVLVVTGSGESTAKSGFAGAAFVGLAFSIARDSTATDNSNVVQSSALAVFNGDANRDFLNVQRVDACTPGQTHTYALTAYATTPQTSTYIGSFVWNGRLTVSSGPAESIAAAGTTYITSANNSAPTIVTTLPAVCPAAGTLLIAASGESAAVSNLAGMAFIGIAYSIARDSTATDNDNVVQSSALARFNGDANRDFLTVQRRDTCTPGQSYTYRLTAYTTTPQTNNANTSFVWNGRLTALRLPSTTASAPGATIVASSTNATPTVVTSMNVVCPASGNTLITASGESAALSGSAGSAFIGLAYSIARDSTATDNGNVVQSSALAVFSGDANRDFLNIQRPDTCTPGVTNTYHLTAYATTPQTSTTGSFVWNGRLTAVLSP